jgi:type IV secretion system protein VirB2
MKHKQLTRLAGYTLAALAFAAPAYASGSGMPWEGPLQQVLDSITGPVARAVGVIAIVMAGFTIAFSDGGSGVRKLAWAGLGLACVFAAATWGLTLFGFAGGAVL